MRLRHPGRNTIKKWSDLLNKVDSLAKFEKNIIKEAKKIKDKNEESQLKRQNNFKGEVFEVFAEALINAHGNDRRIGVANYKPVNRFNGQEDLGADGVGIGTNNSPATVQVKFKSNPMALLTANGDHLTNFKNTSHEIYNVNFTDKENMLVVTNCTGIHHFTATKMLNNKVRCLNRDHIKWLVDDNLPFWDEFRKLTTPIVIKRTKKTGVDQ